jgi:hypothetical protein
MHKSREYKIFFEKLHLPAKVNILQYWQRNFICKTVYPNGFNWLRRWKAMRRYPAHRDFG